MKTGLFVPSTQVILVQATSDFLTADLLSDLGLFQEELCPVSSLSSFFYCDFLLSGSELGSPD